MTAAPSPAAGGTKDTVRWNARQWAVLFLLSGNMILDALEVSVVLVALPAIGAHFGLSVFNVQWMMSGFALGFAVLLVGGGRITVRFGRRRAYLAAMLLFTLASVAGGLANSVVLLVATRLVKGACAALTAPTGLAIIGSTFPQGPQQRRAVSVYSLFGAAGFTLGLLLSGLILRTGQEEAWRWTFLFPAPVALVLLMCGLRLLPRDTDRLPARTRSTGLVLLRNGPLLRAALGAAVFNGSYHSLLVTVTFAARDELGLSPWQTALALLPACVPLAVTVPFAGRFVIRYGTARPIALGAFAAFAGCALYLWRPDGAGYATSTLPALLLVGTGLACAFAALNMQATSTVDPRDRHLAVPLYQTAVQLGAMVLLPLTALLLTRHDDGPALSLVLAASGTGLLVSLTALRGRAAAPLPGKVQP
ncbi:MFS transporter [Streptomyces sp. NPDC059906]|uniref:MFS transporter n=1 Tax=Streptomyces sp. NPDC059906 TaxID=3346997 RepID=UPI003664DAB5